MTRIRRKRIRNILESKVQKILDYNHENLACRDSYLDAYGRDVLTDKNGFCPKQRKRIVSDERTCYKFENIYAFYYTQPVILICGFTWFSSNKAWYATATFESTRTLGCMGDDIFNRAMLAINDSNIKRFISLCHEYHLDHLSGDLIEQGKQKFKGKLYYLYDRERYDDFDNLSCGTITKEQYIKLEKAKCARKFEDEIDNMINNNLELKMSMGNYAMRHKKGIEELIELSETVPESGIFI